MSVQIDYNDLRYAHAAAEILRRHDPGEPEANITSAVRDFLIVTGLVSGDDKLAYPVAFVIAAMEYDRPCSLEKSDVPII